MGCGCENRRLMGDLERARKLAKAAARMEGEDYAIYRNPDGTYNFCREGMIQRERIIEYVTKY